MARQIEEYHNTDPGTRSPTSSSLSERHWQTLVEGSAIAPDIVRESGAVTIEHGSELPGVFSERQRCRAPGILFVSHRPNGEASWCFRPDWPNPKRPGHKYEQPAKALGGAGNVLDILPSQRHLIADTSCPVIFCEGAKKMLSVVSGLRAAGERALVVSVVGCWNFLHEGGQVIPDMQEIPLEGRRATVMYDSDLLRKVEVQEAAKRLAEYLQERGAATFVTFFHDAEDGSKVGADDFFVSGGTIPELRLLTRRFDPDDFRLVRLSRDQKLGEMISDLRETYEAMPVARQGDCTDRATVRALLEETHVGTVTSEGVIVRISSRRLARAIRRSRRAVQKSLDRLERDGYLRRIEESKEQVEKRGAAYLLYASRGGSAQSSHYRKARHSTKRNSPEESNARNTANRENPDTYASLYGGGYPTRPPSEEVPELRAPKCVHTWGRKDGRRVVVESEYFYRLDKPRQEILMYLLEEGGEAHEEELLARFASKSTRLRDFRRRKLAPLMGWRYRRDRQTGSEERLETGPAIIASDADGMVGILPAWREALEEHRQATDEDGDTARQAEKYRRQSKAYRERDKSPADEQESPLQGKERVRRNVREREREDRERWAEEMRRRVGETPETFLAEEMEDVCYALFRDVLKRYRCRGGNKEDLWRAVRAGPYRLRKAEVGLYVEHADGRGEDAYDRKVRETAARIW